MAGSDPQPSRREMVYGSGGGWMTCTLPTFSVRVKRPWIQPWPLGLIDVGTFTTQNSRSGLTPTTARTVPPETTPRLGYAFPGPVRTLSVSMVIREALQKPGLPQ